MNNVQVTVVETDVLDRILQELEELRTPAASIEKHWYTLHEAAELKGISFEVLRKLPRWHRPNFGRATCMIAGSRRYNEVYAAADVYAWLGKTEADLHEEYLELLDYEK